MNTIIAAIDFTTDYNTVVEHSIDYALRLQAKLRFVFVMSSLPPTAEHWIPVAEYEKVIATVKTDYLNRLETLASLARARGAEADHRLLLGYPSAAIIDAAEEIHASLIIVGHRHHGILHELFGSSVSRGLLKVSCIPILVMPDPNTVDGPAPESHAERDEEPYRFIGQT